jgi:chromate reductase, NAD(P)H dehydrogenase (quinone)
MKKILAISGSTRIASSNLKLVKAIASLSAGVFDVEIYNNLASLAIFNPDIAIDRQPAEVIAFRQKIASADGVLICTPEYAMGVPGALKNAIDWTVATAEFSHKPTALITASTSGLKAHDSLLGTLKVIEAAITDDTQFVISFIKTKVNDQGLITDADALEKVQVLISALEKLINDAKQ